MNAPSRREIVRLIALIVIDLIEAVAALSVVLRAEFVPLGAAYPAVVSAVIILMPTLVGLLSRRWEAAMVVGVLPFWVLGVVYQIVYVPVWNLDLLSIGNVLTPFVAVSAFALGLSYLGWLLRRIFFGRESTELLSA
jgi:hypothetical protein